MALVSWVVGVALLAGAAWLYSKWCHSYWESRGVTTPPITPFLGHVHKIFNSDPGRQVFDTEVYTKYGGSNYCGLYEFHNPILFVGNPELMKHIMVKDFDHFTDRRYFETKTKRDKVIGDMLTVKKGPAWKALRSVMSPIFTSGKMKSMYTIVSQKADDLVKYSLKQASKEGQVEMKDNFGRFTMDTIASCAFGIESSSFDNLNSEFTTNAAEFFSTGKIRFLRLIAFIAFPKLLAALNISFSGPEVDFFTQVVERTLSMRKAGNKRGDFLDLLLEARASLDEEDSINKDILSDRSILSQSVLFLVAGYDTTASTLAFSSYELAKNPQEQQRLREELHNIMKETNGELTYQGIVEAKFLNACINETLRMYPPVPTTERVCTKHYQLSGTDLYLKPGDTVQLPIWCLHYDTQYWPEPEQYRPDRFLAENKADIQSFTHLPFGMGPRNCIAMRFALMETKVALAKMILAAEMTLVEGQEKLDLVTGGGVIKPKHGIKMILRPISEE